MTKTLKQRTIRSFVLRAGRMTDAQEKAYQTLWDEYGLVFHHHRLNLQEAFGREASLVLEIGFGMGDSLLNQAINEPHRDFLGVEVHKPGVGRLMNEAKKAGVTNLRVICEDAVEVLADGLGPQSLEGVQIYFPDPWHKKRHHKRRIIQPSFINLLAHRVRLAYPHFLIRRPHHRHWRYPPMLVRMIPKSWGEPLLRCLIQNSP